jgi:molybdate transport system substrate-binding protein
VYAYDDRRAPTYVKTGNVDAGLVYRSDACIASKVGIAAPTPAASQEPTVYAAAITKGSKKGAAAHAFLDFLGGPAAGAALARHGFTASEKQAETN